MEHVGRPQDLHDTLRATETLRAAATASVLAAWPLRWRRGAERGGAELRDALERRGYVEVELSMEEVKLLEEVKLWEGFKWDERDQMDSREG